MNSIRLKNKNEHINKNSLISIPKVALLTKFIKARDESNLKKANRRNANVK